MFQQKSVPLDKLPPRTLYFTYDDGPGSTDAAFPAPGPRTLELAEYLASKRIRSTFFVIGAHADQHRETLQKMAKLGHLLANHTYKHPGATEWKGDDVDHFDEIRRTHEIIAPHVDGRFLFRSPGGTEWPPGKPNLVNQLNSDSALKQYSGPIGWTVDSEDWKYWRDRKSVQSAAEKILNKISNSAVVLFHDCSTLKEMDIREGNRALEAAQIIVPELLHRGYNFRRLDEIP